MLCSTLIALQFSPVLKKLLSFSKLVALARTKYTVHTMTPGHVQNTLHDHSLNKLYVNIQVNWLGRLQNRLEDEMCDENISLPPG